MSWSGEKTKQSFNKCLSHRCCNHMWDVHVSSSKNWTGSLPSFFDSVPIWVYQPIMRHKVQGGTLRRPLRFSRVNRPLPPNCLAVPYITPSVPGWELRHLVSILNHKPKRQSACLAICLCLGLLSVYVLSYHLCSTMKQAQPSPNEI